MDYAKFGEIQSKKFWNNYKEFAKEFSNIEGALSESDAKFFFFQLCEGLYYCIFLMI